MINGWGGGEQEGGGLYSEVKTYLRIFIAQ